MASTHLPGVQLQPFGSGSDYILRAQALPGDAGGTGPQTRSIVEQRFEWRFGLAAAIANMHEVFATFAFISLMRLEFSPTVLAAILTVIGYSLNGTIIIFDRIREHLKGRRHERL